MRRSRTPGVISASCLADRDAYGSSAPATSSAAPDRATFLTNLGYAYQKQGLLDKAVESQRRAIALDAKLGSAWINLGNALADMGQYEAAREALQRAESLDPSDPRPKASLRDLAELEKRQPARQ